MKDLSSKDVLKKIETLSEMIPIDTIVRTTKFHLDDYASAVKSKDKARVSSSGLRLMMSLAAIMNIVGNEDSRESSSEKTRAFLLDELKRLQKNKKD